MYTRSVRSYLQHSRVYRYQDTYPVQDSVELPNEVHMANALSMCAGFVQNAVEEAGDEHEEQVAAVAGINVCQFGSFIACPTGRSAKVPTLTQEQAKFVFSRILGEDSVRQLSYNHRSGGFDDLHFWVDKLWPGMFHLHMDLSWLDSPPFTIESTESFSAWRCDDRDQIHLMQSPSPILLKAKVPRWTCREAKRDVHCGPASLFECTMSLGLCYVLPGDASFPRPEMAEWIGKTAMYPGWGGESSTLKSAHYYAHVFSYISLRYPELMLDLMSSMKAAFPLELVAPGRHTVHFEGPPLPAFDGKILVDQRLGMFLDQPKCSTKARLNGPIGTCWPLPHLCPPSMVRCSVSGSCFATFHEEYPS